MGWVLLFGFFTISFSYYYPVLSNRSIWWLTGLDIFDLLALGLVAYALGLAIHRRLLPEGYSFKSILAWQAFWKLIRLRRLAPSERTALLAMIVKGYFMPLMVGWLLISLSEVCQFALRIPRDTLTWQQWFFAAFHLILLIDVSCFLLGYAVEHPKLKNEIRSVDGTLSGWFVTLICYPPLIEWTRAWIGWSNQTLPTASEPLVAQVSAVAVLALMSIYAWASLALGLKASNLTNRGIVTRGPYRWVRHPAYAAKSAAWITAGLPLALAQFQSGLSAGLGALIGMLVWLLIYILRALTEERHLRKDPEYQSYCAKVHWRFVPGLV